MERKNKREENLFIHGLAFGGDIGIRVEVRGLEDLKPIAEC